MAFDLRMTSGAKKNLEMLVADDGNGWPEAIVPVGRVFDKGVTTTDGSGLGLYHVRRIDEEMGGVVEAKAAEADGELDGARVKLSLPV